MRSVGLTCSSIAVFISVLSAVSGAKTIVHVPADQPTIQAGINVAHNGDVVLVSPGTYVENVNFMGKAITVRSARGAKVTVIDGSKNGPVVTFNQSETASAVLKGFTIQNGQADEGGGIAVENSSPTITNNTITHNGGCNGVGIGVGFGSPVIKKNRITFNAQVGCSGGIGGGGISLRGAASAQIIGNTISDNSMGSDGGGIALFAAGTPLIQANIIRNNVAGGVGGGISMFNQADANIIDNVIRKNKASQGGGVYWLTPSGTRGPFLVNDTIANNNSVSTQGSEIFADGFDISAVVINTIIVGHSGQTAFYCGNFNDVNPPVIRFNNVFNSGGSTYGGICTDPTGSNGNISADPLFFGPSNFRLQASSPAIDAGDNSAPDLPATDITGHARIVNGRGGPVAVVDMGAYEFVPTVF